MLHHLPKFEYCGLTVILSNPSRFDTAALLSGIGGWYFFSECIKDYFVRGQLCIRVSEDKTPLLPNTKCVLLLGLKALREWTDVKQDITLGEQRGSPLYIKNSSIIAIASYLPQDVIDMQDYESRLNPALVDLAPSSKYSEVDSDIKSEKRRHGKTARTNWRWWLKQDSIKACKIVSLYNGLLPTTIPTKYIIYPSAEEVIRILTYEKNRNLYLDLETDSALNITCFGFAFSIDTVYVVPCLLPNYDRGYTLVTKVFRLLAIAVRDNTTVAHNGAAFDFFILAHKYRIGIGIKTYDTMLAHHRCYPSIEKSLGHCTSLYTYEPYHKDEGNFSYGSVEQANALWSYCGKDVRTMILIKEAIDTHAAKKPGLQESIQQANDSIRPYLITTLQGIKFDNAERLRMIEENDHLMMQYLRIINILIGREFLQKLQRKSKSPLPNSNNQCCAYFHEALGYPVVMRSKKTGKPSLAKKAFFKLRIHLANLEIENPVLDLIIKYRATAYATSHYLNFIEWKSERSSTTYKISGTNTFRLSSSKILQEWGGNLQNISKKYRKIFVPDNA